MKCPGQDWRYWTGDVVFEVPCPQCGAAVEVFKDESRARCRGCGHRFMNPGIDLRCAQWCSLAEQCLGYVPERDAVAGSSEQALAGRLIKAVVEELKSDPAAVARALAAYRYARTLVSEAGGDPRVVLTAALLREVAEAVAARKGRDAGSARAREVLERLGADTELADRASAIVAACLADRPLDSIEFLLVRDAGGLAGLAAKGSAGSLEDRESRIESCLVTPAAKEVARRAFSSKEPRSGE